MTTKETFRNNKKSNYLMLSKGFSLIELLIVLAITAILASFAYPNYRTYMTRMHRLDGQTALLDLAHRMERQFAIDHTYQRATIGTGKSTDVLHSNQSAQGWYTLSITQATDTRFALQATPNASQAINDTHCQSFTFNSLGRKGIARGPGGLPTGDTSVCW